MVRFLINSGKLFHREELTNEIAFQQTFVGPQEVLKTSSRHVLKTSSTRLQRNNFTSWRRFQDLSQDVLLLHKQSFCLLSHHDASPFQKRCYIYFPAEYFLGLIYRLVARVSSIFQTLSQKPIFNPVGH